MKLGQLYEQLVAEGIKQDPRSTQAIKAELAAEKEAYEKSDKKKKKFYDMDRLTNPFADTRLLYGDPKSSIKSIMIGIDMEVGEIVLADRLREKGTSVDLVMTHHPEGHALAKFQDVMSLQTDVFCKQGVPVAIAENLTRERMSEVGRGVAGANHMQAVDAARLLDIPYMCCHTPADNHVYSYLQNIFDTKKPKQLKDILDLLMKEPEYQEASQHNAAPFILSGSSDSQAGKIMVDMTGGTEGNRDVFTRLAQYGVSTIVCMHLSEAHLKKAKAERINVVNAGHIASDNLGLNLLLDAVLKKENVKIIEASGFRRFVRKK